MKEKKRFKQAALKIIKPRFFVFCREAKHRQVLCCADVAKQNGKKQITEATTDPPEKGGGSETKTKAENKQERKKTEVGHNVVLAISPPAGVGHHSRLKKGGRLERKTKQSGTPRPKSERRFARDRASA